MDGNERMGSGQGEKEELLQEPPPRAGRRRRKVRQVRKSPVNTLLLATRRKSLFSV